MIVNNLYLENNYLNLQIESLELTKFNLKNKIEYNFDLSSFVPNKKVNIQHKNNYLEVTQTESNTTPGIKLNKKIYVEKNTKYILFIDGFKNKNTFYVFPYIINNFKDKKVYYYRNKNLLHLSSYTGLNIKNNTLSLIFDSGNSEYIFLYVILQIADIR